MTYGHRVLFGAEPVMIARPAEYEAALAQRVCGGGCGGAAAKGSGRGWTGYVGVRGIV